MYVCMYMYIYPGLYIYVCVSKYCPSCEFVLRVKDTLPNIWLYVHMKCLSGPSIISKLTTGYAD